MARLSPEAPNPSERLLSGLSAGVSPVVAVTPPTAGHHSHEGESCVMFPTRVGSRQVCKQGEPGCPRGDTPAIKGTWSAGVSCLPSGFSP